jgi:hypothetical protein
MHHGAIYRNAFRQRDAGFSEDLLEIDATLFVFPLVNLLHP